MVADFGSERGWDSFHTPKNLIMALTGEVGELAELFQWLTDDQSRALMDDSTRRVPVEEEIADVFIYLLRLADVLQIDLAAAAEAKLLKNAKRYPIQQVYGRAVKYSELGSED